MRKLLLLAIIFIYGCSNATEATTQSTEQPKPSNTVEIILTHTPTITSTNTPTSTITSTPEPTNTPEPTITLTPIPESLKEQIAENYEAMVLIQTNAIVLLEIAERINKGEVEKIEGGFYMIGMAHIMNAADEAFLEIIPIDELKADWEKMVKFHEETKGILIKWMEEEIQPGILMEEELEIPTGEIDDLIGEIDDLMISVEELLGNTYRFDTEELKTMQEDIIENVEEIFETPQP